MEKKEMHFRFVRLLGLGVGTVSILVSGAAGAAPPPPSPPAQTPAAAPPTKEECVAAFSRGQDLRDQNQVSRARATFLICANTACPQLVQADCARFADELEKLVSSLTFSSRDDQGIDLPDTQVFIDDNQVAARLEAGTPIDVDPGPHTIRFVHAGKTVVHPIVVGEGEKARHVAATFGEQNTATSTPVAHEKPKEEEFRPVLPLVVAGVGAAAAVTGLVLTFVGFGKVPDGCSTSSHQCMAAPGTTTFSDAKSGVKLANVGIGTTIAGGAVLAGGLIWYFVQPVEKTTTTGSIHVSPWAGGNSGGVTAFGTF
ncbi:MAG: hypothetical protein FWD73_14360 [Polyangiaceae bacterium]|nr:hypothetical protein [Polyangiaceae bacterium]